MRVRADFLTSPKALAEAGLLGKASKVLNITIFDEDQAIGLTVEQAKAIGVLDVSLWDASRTVDVVP